MTHLEALALCCLVVLPLWNDGRRWFAGVVLIAWFVFKLTTHPIDKIAAAVVVVTTLYCLRQTQKMRPPPNK